MENVMLLMIAYSMIRMLNAAGTMIKSHADESKMETNNNPVILFFANQLSLLGDIMIKFSKFSKIMVRATNL